MNEISINVFYPTKAHDGQKAVLAALDRGDRFVLLRAGRKFRKTSLMVSWLFEKALTTGLTCPYIAPNRVQAKNIVWNDHAARLLTHFREQGLSYKVNEVELSVTLPNGGRVQLLGVENKEALRGISNWGAVAGDEYDDWAEDIWPTIIRPNLITHKAQAILGGTPKGYRNLYRLEYPQSGERLFTPFHFQSHDNPDLDPIELASLEAEYRQMGDTYYRQEILAEYEKPVGTVYQEWDLQTKYKEFTYDPNLPLHLSWDFGVNDPTAILWLQPNGSELRLVDYYEASNANIEHFVQVINAKPYKTPALETGDIAGNARELVSGKSPITELARLGHYVRTATIPNIPTQVRVAHRFIPRLYVSSSNPSTARFRDCLLNYRYPESKSATAIDQTNEIPIHDEYSHAMRAFEYYCWNSIDPQQRIDKTPPRNSFESFLRKKEEEKWRREEGFVG